MIHTVNGIKIDMVGADETNGYDATEYGVYVYGRDGEEIVSWTGDEWIEDPSIVAAIVNAICSAITE